MARCVRGAIAAAGLLAAVLVVLVGHAPAHAQSLQPQAQCTSLWINNQRKECGGRGVCKPPGVCECEAPWTGETCQIDSKDLAPHNDRYTVETFKFTGCPQGKDYERGWDTECGGPKQGACTATGCVCVKPWTGENCQWREHDIAKLVEARDSYGYQLGSYCHCKRDPSNPACQPKATDPRVLVEPDKLIYVEPTRTSTDSVDCPDVSRQFDYQAEYNKWRNTVQAADAADAATTPTPTAPSAPATAPINQNSPTCASDCLAQNCKMANLQYGSSWSACADECDRLCGVHPVYVPRPYHEPEAGRIKGELIEWKVLCVTRFQSIIQMMHPELARPVGQGKVKGADGKIYAIDSFDLRHGIATHLREGSGMRYQDVLYTKIGNSITDVAMLGSDDAYKATGTIEKQELEGQKKFKAQYWQSILKCTKEFEENFSMYNACQADPDCKEQLYYSVKTYRPNLYDTVPNCCVTGDSTCRDTTIQSDMKEVVKRMKQYHLLEKVESAPDLEVFVGDTR